MEVLSLRGRPTDSGRQAQFRIMKLLGFLLYCLSAVAGIVGLVVAGGPVVDYAWRRAMGLSYSVDPNQLYRDTVMFFLSLILLHLVHLGHRLAGGFEIGSAKKPEAEVLGKKSEG